MQNDIDRRRKEDSAADAYFTTMIDLYALHADFPGLDEADKLRSDPYQRVIALEGRWSVDSPELIDDGQHTAPSRRIVAQFRAYEKLKTSVGPQMGGDIGLPAIRSKCPGIA